MAATILIQSSAAVVTPYGDLDVGPFSVTGTITPVPFSLVLASGNNTFTVPSDARGVVVTPPTSNLVVLISKTTSGDVGMNRPKTTQWIEIFDPAVVPATYYINAASQTTGYTTLLFF